MHDSLTPSPLLLKHLEQLQRLPAGPVLDLACGGGRNGLWLSQQGLPMWFCDCSDEALTLVTQRLADQQLNAVLWHQDLETGSNPFAGRRFAAIICHHYLHRPLLPWLAQALLPGGVLVYETFTIEQASIGRPRNPDFLLQPGELAKAFASWSQIHYREGKLTNPERYLAQLVARKPE
ncbi:class I SAM-dependent methyltransferase [Ferrimonas senticii]|uniref:class I SAM-dependent methyltransferase n=1 Tax=Ferrimonas senticii TaxID=394566 RepID=UPI0003FA4409|nr:class I SAM-dependent methyltransferase [Ferrimonas senticii]